MRNRAFGPPLQALRHRNGRPLQPPCSFFPSNVSRQRILPTVWYAWPVPRYTSGTRDEVWRPLRASLRSPAKKCTEPPPTEARRPHCSAQTLRVNAARGRTGKFEAEAVGGGWRELDDERRKITHGRTSSLPPCARVYAVKVPALTARPSVEREASARRRPGSPRRERALPSRTPGPGPLPTRASASVSVRSRCRRGRRR